MARKVEERLDPTRLLPGARTVIVGLFNYYRENPTLAWDSGKIARYAGGRDYHRVVESKLKRFAHEIQGHYPQAKTWWSVDSGPVLERYWAEQAGVGWVGKNTLLINPGLGSWTFIGVVLTDLVINPDQPHADHCGTCSRCIEACPTDALREPGVLDSGRCISYWTIEHRGEIEPEAGSHLGGWIFGCDDCQTACPWNRHAEPTSEPEFQIREEFSRPNLVQWAHQTWEEWDALTRGSAVRRAGYEGFARNCRIALENTE